MKMKINVQYCAEYAGVYEQVLYEGDEVVIAMDEKENHLIDLQAPRELPINVFAGATGLKVSDKRAEFYLSRYYNGEKFHPHLFVGLYIYGLINDDLGKDICIGSAGRFQSPKINEELFGIFDTILLDTGYRGWVSVSFDLDKNITSAKLGIPSYGLYALLECRHGTVADFIKNPGEIPHRWCVATLLTRWPWPAMFLTNHEHKLKPITVLGYTSHFKRHLCLFDDDIKFGVNQFTIDQPDNNIIGVVSAWSSWSMSEAVKFLHQIYGSLEFPDMQPRFGLRNYIENKWIKVKSLLES